MNKGKYRWKDGTINHDEPDPNNPFITYTVGSIPSQCKGQLYLNYNWSTSSGFWSCHVRILTGICRIADRILKAALYKNRWSTFHY